MKRFVLFILICGYCFASNYYVSNQGSDENPGTINSPFKTIQKAADVVVGGDIINILEGSYHEEVTLNNTSGSQGGPIIFQPFSNDRVVLDGTRPITTVWSNHQGNIWKTELDFDIWQLFLDRKEQVMARWPNANFDDGSVWDKENHWAHGTMDQSQEPAYENGTLIDKPHGNVDLSSIGFSVVDAIAILNVGSFRTWTRKINTHSGSMITYDPVPENEWKVKHHDYYLEGKLEFLDSEGEWFFDHAEKMLYFWTPQGQNPNSLNIRGKVQSYAFSIANSDYVEIRSLEFFGTTFHFDNSDYSVVENCNLWYPSCHKRMLGVTNTQPEMSVFRNSSFCTVSKSAFRYTDGSALEMYSHNNTIEDCYFYHIDYSVTDLNSLMTTIQMGGANNIIRRNTMHKLGASATLNPGDAGLITLNNISDTGHMQGDGAMVQVMTGQSPGTEISYNWLHSSVKYGARFDGNGASNNGIMHHNVFWGLDNAGIMAKGYEFKIYNNTVLYGPDNKNDILIMIGQGGNEGTETFNNVANKISGHRSGTFEDYPVPGIYSNNVNGYELGRNIEGLIMDPENLDFRPNPDSILVDAGIAIDGFTDGYVGAAPDIGAYEYGAEMWVPGITWNLSQKFGNEFIEPIGTILNDDNYYLNFDGLNDFVDFGPNILSGSGDFSISLWLKTSTLGQVSHIFQKREPGSTGFIGEYILEMMADGRLHFWTFDGSSRWTVTSTDSYADGLWHHVVLVQDGSISGGRMYVDGVAVGSNSNGVVNLRSDINTFAGGDKRDNIEFFEGSIDEISIFEIALNEEDISLLNEGEFSESQPIAFWEFNEGQGITSYNTINGQYTGQISGATWSEGSDASNNPPIASSFVSSSVEDAPSTIDLVSQDADNDPISYTILDGPFHGELVFSSDASVSYSPYNNFFGSDSFSYVAYDGTDYSEPATVTIEVSEVNDKPIAMADHFMIAEDDTLRGNLIAEDGDHFPIYMDMQDLTYSVTLNVLNGTLSIIDTSGAFTYTPNPNFFGADSFQFSVTDNGTTGGVDGFLADTAMIHLFVEPMNDAPVLSSFVDTSMHEDSSLVLTVFASDIDNAELNVYAYSSQNRVSAFVEDTLLYIIPDADWNGTAEIVVVANDNMSRASDVEEFTVEVVPVNDPPFFTMDHYHAMGDMTTGLEHWLYADDIDSDIFFTLEGAPAWISLDGSKMVGQPEQDGEYVFTVSVSDSEYVVSEQFTVHIADHRPEVLSLRDVPNDQGKQMHLVWKPGQVDPSLPFTQFSTWRKVNPDSTQPDTSNLWDFIASVPWIGTEDEYSMVVPTLGDSTAHGIYPSTFRVTAHTEDVALYHVSEPVTGFSIDNLHPTVPQGLTALESGTSVILQWTTQIDEDFSYHNIYRNDLGSLDPAMVFTTTDSFYVDQEGTNGSYEYWITAVDSAGNESDASDIAAVVLSASAQTAVPTVFALEQNYPNPFNPSTQIRYALPEATIVTITVYDMMGRKVKTLVQDIQSAGYHTALWNATNDRGLPVSAGMYIYTLQAGDHHHMKKMILLK